MKILYVGSVELSDVLLRTLLNISEAEIVGVITKSSSIFNADHRNLAPLAVSYNIPYKYVKDINAPHIISWIISLRPDVIFCFGWSSLIKEELINLPSKGIVGYHPTLLPQNRGRHPLIWTLTLGLHETGSTFFIIDNGADSGPIVHQEVIGISESDNARSLYDKVIHTAIDQLSIWVPLMDQNKLQLIEQDHLRANYWRKRSKDDGEIDFRMGSRSIYNLVRALTKPYVGAHILFRNSEYKVWACHPGENISLNVEPGKVLDISDIGITVRAADGSIVITDHDLPIDIKPGDYLL